MTRHIGQQIKQHRDQRGWTQIDLAQRAQITDEYVCELERGVRQNPSLSVIRRLAEALGVPPGELIR